MVTGLFILGGKTIGDFLIEMRNKKIVNNIYYELPKHIHIAEISGEILIDKETFKKQIFGSVIFEKESTNEPFEKYKKDIAKQLGILK